MFFLIIWGGGQGNQATNFIGTSNTKQQSKRKKRLKYCYSSLHHNIGPLFFRNIKKKIGSLTLIRVLIPLPLPWRVKQNNQMKRESMMQGKLSQVLPPYSPSLIIARLLPPPLRWERVRNKEGMREKTTPKFSLVQLKLESHTRA